MEDTFQFVFVAVKILYQCAFLFSILFSNLRRTVEGREAIKPVQLKLNFTKVIFCTSDNASNQRGNSYRIVQMVKTMHLIKKNLGPKQCTAKHKIHSNTEIKIFIFYGPSSGKKV